MRTGTEGTVNVAILLPDDDALPAQKPKRWRPLPIGVAYASAEVETEEVKDGRLVLFVIGPEHYISGYPCLNALFSHSRCVNLTRDGMELSLHSVL
jgi:hypothetical protein